MADSMADDNNAPQRCALLVRGGHVIADARRPVIPDGAVCIDGDRIVAVGTYAELRRRYAPARELGSPQHILFPGLINAHDHGRSPSSLQLGIPDDVLELWIIDLMRLPALDPELVAACACAEQIESGVTTVLHSFFEGAAGNYAAAVEATARGYERAGMRAMLALGMLDQSHIAAQLQAVLPQLPAALQGWLRELLAARKPVAAEEYFAVAPAWCAQRRGHRVGGMLGPVSVHWCSEPLLQRIWGAAEATGTYLQTHLLESAYQRRSAQARYGKSAVAYLAGLNLLTPNLSCAHCVQVDARDIDLLAARNVSVVHNASSNLRLHNGIAPLPAMLRGGVNVALGMDSLSLNDDGDMLQEMRLAARLHRGVEGAPGADEVLAMATVNGARALGIDDRVGTLEPGKKADLVALKVDAGAEYFGSHSWSAVEHVVYRAQRQDIDTVVIDGEVVLHEGRHRRVDRTALLREVADVLGRGPAPGELQWQSNVAGLKPYLRQLLLGG